MIHITDIEAAINYWRYRANSDGVSLSKDLSDLATIYALMCYQHKTWVARDLLSDAAAAAWLTWYDTTPDTPCIAICSTSQGDESCKGCGRSFEEVKRWSEYSPLEKRVVWQRITHDGTAWRFNKYAERAQERAHDPKRLANSAALPL